MTANYRIGTVQSSFRYFNVKDDNFDFLIRNLLVIVTRIRPKYRIMINLIFIFIFSMFLRHFTCRTSTDAWRESKNWLTIKINYNFLTEYGKFVGRLMGQRLGEMENCLKNKFKIFNFFLRKKHLFKFLLKIK